MKNIQVRNSEKRFTANIQLLWALFPEDPDAKRDFLYRKTEEKTPPVFYLVSKREPTPVTPGILVESKPYEPVLRKGSRYRFRLRANATITKKPEGSESKRRKRDDVYMEALARNKELPESERLTGRELLERAGREWLEKRSVESGFRVEPGDLFVEGYSRLDGMKGRGNQKIRIGAIDYSGILEVTDRDRFQETLFRGLGKARAFGCGLLLIQPLP